MVGTIINDLVEWMRIPCDAVVYGDKSEVFNVFMHPTLFSVRLRRCARVQVIFFH